MLFSPKKRNVTYKLALIEPNDVNRIAKYKEKTNDKLSITTFLDKYCFRVDAYPLFESEIFVNPT